MGALGRIGLAFAFVAGLGVAPARAQDQASFDAALTRLHPGQTITAVDTSGRTVRGTIVTVTASMLVVRVRGLAEPVVLETPRIARITERDSVWNGVLIGSAAGAVLGASVGSTLADEYPNEHVSRAGTALQTAMGGALLGLLVDAVIVRHIDVYVAPGRVAVALRWPRPSR